MQDCKIVLNVTKHQINQVVNVKGKTAKYDNVTDFICDYGSIIMS
jgi:hypothetical protein